MELKPLNEMTERELKDEVKRRTDCGVEFSLAQVLLRLRENDIGTENLTPPEPEWKRWRKWPEEKPVDRSRVIVCRMPHNDVPFGGEYVASAKAVIGPKGVSFDMLGKERTWRYLTEPPCWKVVTRDGNPSEAGWYEILPNEPYRRFRYWEGKVWNLCMGGPICGDPIAYCPIAPAPKFEGDNEPLSIPAQ